MNTIVLNTLTRAVTEYDWNFQSITPTHLGDATGLFALGGETDNELPIAASFATGKTQMGTPLRKRVDEVFFSMTGDTPSTLTVDASAAYSYTFTVSANGVSRAQPGRGLRENYLAVGFANVAGGDFRIDRVEINIVPSDNRRIGS